VSKYTFCVRGSLRLFGWILLYSLMPCGLCSAGRGLLHALCVCDTLPLYVLEGILQANPDGGLGEGAREGAAVADKHGRLPLHVACGRQGNVQTTVDVIKLLLQVYPEACKVATGTQSNLPLHELLMNVSTNIDIDLLGALMITAYKEAVSHENSDHQFPLQLAIARHSCSESFILILLDAYPDAAKTSVAGFASLLHWSCSQIKSVTLILKLLSCDPEAAKKKDSGGNLPIHVCCERGDQSSVEVIKHLIDVYPEGMLVKDKDGNTPLHSACETLTTNLTSVATMMIRAGRKAAEMADRDGNLPIHSACEKRPPVPDTIALLIDAFPGGLQKKDKQGNLPLHSAIELGNEIPLQVLGTMISVYPDAVKVKDKDGNTPLHSACECRTKDLTALVEQLLAADEGNVAPKTADRDGNLPLHSACEKRPPNADVIRTLLAAYPGGLEKKDKQGNLPLHSAIELGDVMPVSVIGTMVSMFPGATKVKDKDGNTPLHSALHSLSMHFDEVAGILLDADPSCVLVPDKRFGALVVWAIDNQKVEFLGKACTMCPGVATRDVVRCKKRLSPLHYACYNEKSTVEMLQVLIDANPIALKTADGEGKLPLRILQELPALDGVIEFVEQAYPEANSRMFKDRV
jgi:ankyrin repeat protein